MVVSKHQHHSHYRRYLWTIGTPGDTVNCTVGHGRMDLVPMEVPVPCVVDAITVAIKGAGAGSLKAAIYANGPSNTNPYSGVLKAETGAVSHNNPGTWRPDVLSVDPVFLEPGLYWVGVMSSESTTILDGMANHWTNGWHTALRRRYFYTADYSADNMEDPCPWVSNAGTSNQIYGVNISYCGEYPVEGS